LLFTELGLFTIFSLRKPGRSLSRRNRSTPLSSNQNKPPAISFTVLPGL
jgi:hypothetical protein